MKYRFPKSEKVVSLKIINALFDKKTPVFFVYPFKISFLVITQPETLNQVLIIVPKRNFKKAVDRNKIKRQIREIYRLNKHQLQNYTNPKGIHLAVSIAYVGKSGMDYSKANMAFIKVLKQLEETIEKNNTSTIHIAN